MSAEIKFRYYFVDEAGDLTFFDLWTWTIIATNLMESGMAIATH